MAYSLLPADDNALFGNPVGGGGELQDVDPVSNSVSILITSIPGYQVGAGSPSPTYQGFDFLAVKPVHG